jgi:uncharacterized protein (TIGR03435 family)
MIFQLSVFSGWFPVRAGGQVMRALVAGLALAYCCTALGQAPAASTSFEVASIRPTPPAERQGGTWSLPKTGEFHTHNLSLGYLIHLAWNVDPTLIVDKPAWMDSDPYDINAKPEAGIKLTREQLRPMLQNLLEQRFHLAVHTEIRQMKGYALVVAKGGPKLKSAKGDVTPNWRDDTSTGNLKGRNWSSEFLAAELTPAAGLPVVDQTGLNGHYDVSAEYAPDLEHESPLPSLFTVVESLGLRLVAQKVPVSVLVIDHVDRTPTEN